MTTKSAEANAWEDALVAQLRASGGHVSDGPLAGHPLMILYSTGARTGERRRSIVTFSRDSDAYVIAGSASGAPKDPAWIANLRANRDVELEVENESFPATATIVEGPERERLWAQHAERLPWFADYPAQVGGRTIPVVRLTRRSAD